MKKILFILLLMVSTIYVMAQQYTTAVTVQSLSTNFTRNLPINTQVTVLDLDRIYILTAAQTSGTDMNDVITAVEYTILGSTDLGDYWKNDGSSTATANWDIGTWDLDAQDIRITGDFSGDDIDLTGESNAVTQRNTVQNGAKTASFIHDALLGDIGAYTLSTSGSVVVSIHNLTEGMQGTIFLEVLTSPSSITVATYSDAGVTGLPEVVLGSTISHAENKFTSITYTYAYNSANIVVYLIFGQEN
jgi:hypothetical protein